MLINIDRKLIEFNNEYITVEKIRELAKCPKHYAVFLMIPGPRPDWRLDTKDWSWIYLKPLRSILNYKTPFFYTTSLTMTGG